DRHPYDLRCRAHSRADPDLPAGIRGRDPARDDRRPGHAGARRHQPRPGGPARNVGAHRTQLPSRGVRHRAYLVLGLVGKFLAAPAIFLAAALLCAPALYALTRIRPDEIDYARARNAGTGEAAGKWHRVRDLARNRGLLLFAACLILFQIANASM